MIYRKVLVSSEPIETNQRMERKSVMEVQLLQVCRQVRQEAHDIFWSENAFRFTSQDSEMHQEGNLLRTAGAQNAGLIKHFTIDIQQEEEDREDLEFLAQTMSSPIPVNVMYATSIHEETHRLLQYGVPASSVNLVPPPILEASATNVDRLFARIHQEVNDIIEEALRQPRRIPFDQLVLINMRLRTVRFGLIELDIIEPKPGLDSLEFTA
jgi:hypothetical protein